MYEFSFLALPPFADNRELAERAAYLLEKYAWDEPNPHQAEINCKLSEFMVVATNADGEVVSAAAGNLSMLSEEFYISEIATHPEYQREHNLGSTILRIIESAARLSGAKQTKLWAKPRAREFFYKQGYVQSVPEDEGELEKNLVTN